jgi:branched-chain amino acid aminotransferase
MMLLRRSCTHLPRTHPCVTALRSICASKLTIERTSDDSAFRNRPAKELLQFGTTLSDHMLMIEWTKGEWKDPKIVPYQDLKISPAASALHYGKIATL